MSRKRRDIDELLNAIIAEAKVALTRANFEPNIEHIHRLVVTIEGRIKRFRDERSWSLLDGLLSEGRDGQGRVQELPAPGRQARERMEGIGR